MNENIHTHERRSTLNRRMFNLGVVGSLGTAAFMASLYPRAEASEVSEVSYQPGADAEVEEKEKLPDSPLFYQIILGRIIEQSELARDEVLFVDKFGRPLGNKVKLTPANGYKVSEMVWRYKGGEPVGIPPGWTKVHKEKLSAAYGVPVDEIGMHHVYLDLMKSAHEDCDSMIEMVQRYAAKPVDGDPAGRSFYEVVRNDIPLDGLPDTVAAQMKPLMLGIAAEESRFNKNKKSSKDARGVLQTMEKTEDGYREKHNLESLDPTDILMQVGVAGMHVETSYRELFNSAGEDLAYIKEHFFANDEQDFETCFVVPALVNAYNAGARRIAEVITWFVQEVREGRLSEYLPTNIDTPSGFDVYMTMVHACAEKEAVHKFGPDASQYTEKVYAWSVTMQDTFERPELVASNG